MDNFPGIHARKTIATVNDCRLKLNKVFQFYSLSTNRTISCINK